MTKLQQRKCSCGEIAVTQTANGKYQEEIGALPQNHGYYCNKCYDEGVQIENEAMYGDCLNNCKC